MAAREGGAGERLVEGMTRRPRVSVRSRGWPWIAAAGVAALVVVLATVMYQVVLKPVLKISLVTMILTTVALSLLFENLSLIKYGGYPKTLPGFTSGASFGVHGVYVEWQAIWMIGIMIVCLVGLYFLNNRTMLGKRMTAAATNPQAASLSGVNVSRMILLAFAISGAIGAIAGIAVSNKVGGLSYATGGVYGMMGFIAAVLGGWGSSTGAVVGGLVLGIVQGLSTGLVPAGYANVPAFIILLIVLYARPQGIMGTRVPEGEV